MNGYIDRAIEQKLLNVRTAFLAKVLKVAGNTARVQPLETYKPVGGTAKKKSPVSAVIPRNIKYRAETLTYMESADTKKTKTILVPDNLAVGDIVFVGVCDRDISNAKRGIISEATSRHHNENDGVILRVL